MISSGLSLRADAYALCVLLPLPPRGWLHAAKVGSWCVEGVEGRSVGCAPV